MNKLIAERLPFRKSFRRRSVPLTACFPLEFEVHSVVSHVELCLQEIKTFSFLCALCCMLGLTQ